MKKRGGGRVAAHEIMIGTPAIRNLIRENKIAQMYSSIQTGGKEGMQTLDQCLKEMVKKGMTTVEEARMKSADTRRSEEHTSELQSLMRITNAVFSLKKKKRHERIQHKIQNIQRYE